MSRNDIANLLGMAVETISRLFSQFQEQGLLVVERKHIQILNLSQLQALSNRCSPTEENGEEGTSYSAS
jgi:CRP/FNR family transcriptional regulator